jgi:hypothetical protein
MSDGARVTIRELAAAMGRKPEQVEASAGLRPIAGSYFDHRHHRATHPVGLSSFAVRPSPREPGAEPSGTFG